MNRFDNIDCMIGMKEYPDKYFDLAIVDPPYGINATKLKIRANNKNKQWDDEPPEQNYFDELFRISRNQIIWGMNFLNDFLPRCEKTVIWDKQNDGTYGSDYELAWTSIEGVRQEIFRKMWYGYFYPKEDLPLIHPTQKPLSLYKWLLTKYAKPNDKILDTHVGSASSLIACEDLGFEYVGFELDADYYKAANKRLEQFRTQLKLAI